MTKAYCAKLDPSLSAALNEWASLTEDERRAVEEGRALPARLRHAATLRALAGVEMKTRAAMLARAAERAKRPSYAAQWAAVMRAPGMTRIAQ